jgi:hypothetical protein
MGAVAAEPGSRLGFWFVRAAAAVASNSSDYRGGREGGRRTGSGRRHGSGRRRRSHGRPAGSEGRDTGGWGQRRRKRRTRKVITGRRTPSGEGVTRSPYRATGHTIGGPFCWIGDHFFPNFDQFIREIGQFIREKLAKIECKHQNWW